MHMLAVVLVAAAGVGYVLAAGLRWRALGRGETVAGGGWALWSALALHSAGLTVSLVDPAQRAFAYGALAAWAAVAALVFLRRYLAMPSAWLLVLPAGGMALLLAMAGLASRPPGGEAPTEHRWIVGVHLAFVVAYLAAALVAGSSALAYLVAARLLKLARFSALKLPQLPALERLYERALVVATALLLVVLATGGAAIQLSTRLSLGDPLVTLAVAAMVLNCLALGLRAADRLGRRGLALAAVGSLILAVLSALKQVLGSHA